MLDELFTLKLTLVPGQIVVAVLDEMLTAGVEAELVKLTVFPVACPRRERKESCLLEMGNFCFFLTKSC